MKVPHFGTSDKVDKFIMRVLQASQFLTIIGTISCSRIQYQPDGYPLGFYRENYDYAGPEAEFLSYGAYGNPHHADNYPIYSFDYSVNDPHTGDHKTQWETRNGDVVKGAYSLAEPDGTTRVVEYTADKKHGFSAFIKRLGRGRYPTTLSFSSEKSTEKHVPTTLVYTMFKAPSTPYIPNLDYYTID